MAAPNPPPLPRQNPTTPRKSLSVGRVIMCLWKTNASQISACVERERCAWGVDSQGVPLPTWQGCFTLDENQVFLLGYTPGSYDGPYSVVTPSTQIVGWADLLLSF